MSYPPPDPPPSQTYQDYRPSSRHNLFFGQDNTMTPTRSHSPRKPDVYNPYPPTPGLDEETPYTPPIYSSKTALNPYDSTTPQPYPPYSPAYQDSASPALYQDTPPLGKAPADYPFPADAGYANAPSPPLPKKRSLFSRLFNGDQRFAYFCWIISVIQVGVFIGELVKNAMAMHTPIEIQPTFNPLIGPSSYILINMGARFPPCMHAIPGITDLTSNIWPCLNNTANPPQDGPLCSLSEVCGFGGITGNPPVPDQWFRVIVPIFLHGGIIHILFNLLIQLRLGVDMEKAIGTFRFMLIYFPSGIMGFILGANFAGNGLASTGCSGCLFGIIAVVILDLFYNWRQFQHPKRNLAIILVQVVICFVLGLLPGLDNFSHIGGFFTGLLLGVAIMRAPPKIRARLVDNKHSSNAYELGDTSYASLTGNAASSGRARGFVGYFQHRRKWWWIWNLLRGACLALVIIAMVLLFNNFYVNGGGHCSWCRYLSCLPVNGWCELGDIQNTTSTTSPSRMMLF